MPRLAQIKGNSIRPSPIDQHSVKYIDSGEFEFLSISLGFARKGIRSGLVRTGREVVLQKMGPQKFTFVAPPQKEYSTES